MAGAKKYQVAATMIVVQVPGATGGEVYMRRGRVLPDSIESAEVKRLVALGLVAEVKQPKDDTADADAAAKAAADKKAADDKAAAEKAAADKAAAEKTGK